MKPFRYSRVREAGHTLSEVLVAIALFVVVSAITGALIVSANQTTRRATSAAAAQSQLNDTVLRMSREVAVADEIVSAKPTQLQTVTVRGTSTVHTRFWYAPGPVDPHIGEIRSKEGATAADLGDLDAPINSGYKVLAKDVTDNPTAPQGSSVRTILAYVDAHSNPVVPLTATDLKAVARVKINLNATVKGRSKPLTLVTSMGTRLGSPPEGEQPPPPLGLDCPVPTSTARTATSVTWDWGTAPVAMDNIKIDRTLQAGGPTVTQTVPVATTPWTDSPPVAGEAYFYEFTWTGPLGSSERCRYDVDPMPLPVAPVLVAYPEDYSNNMVKWNAPGAGDPAVDHYVVSRSDTQTGTFTDAATVTGVTWSDTDAAVRAKLGSTSWYKVTAFQTSDATRPSIPSNANDVIQYPAVPNTLAFDQTSGTGSSSSVYFYDATGTNHVAWAASAGSTSGYKVYRTQGATTPNFSVAASVAVNATPQAAPLTLDDTKERGSRYNYWAVGVNQCAADPDMPLPKPPTECLSNNKPGGGVTPVPAEIYQTPSDPVSSVTLDPNLNQNKTTLSFARNGDAGNANDKYCATAGECTYELMRYRDYSEAGWTVDKTGPAGGTDVVLDPGMDEDAGDGDWGSRFDWAFKSCNKAGCSQQSLQNEESNTFPSDFSINDAGMKDGYWYRYNWEPAGGEARLIGSNYSAQLHWDQSMGQEISYSYQVGDAAATGFPAWPSGELVGAVSVVTGGRQYVNTVTSRSDNGKTRTSPGFRYQTAPTTVHSINEKFLCNNAPNWSMYWEVDANVLEGVAATGAYYQLGAGESEGGPVTWSASTYNAGTGVKAFQSVARSYTNGQAVHIKVYNYTPDPGGVSQYRSDSVGIDLFLVLRNIGTWSKGAAPCNTAVWSTAPLNRNYYSGHSANYPGGAVTAPGYLLTFQKTAAG